MSNHYALKAKYGPWCRFGGDSRSDSSTDTANYTTNNANSWDKRAVASDNAVSLTGDGNFLDKSTSFFDNSNRSTLTSFVDQSNHSTNFTDNSLKFDSSVRDSSTNFTDNSNRSVNTTTTDFGAVQAGMAGMTQATNRAFDLSGNVVQTAQTIMKQSVADQQASLTTALTLASRSTSDARDNSAAVLGFANEAIKQSRTAFAEAKDGGQSKMVIGALVVVGAVGIAFAMRGTR